MENKLDLLDYVQHPTFISLKRRGRFMRVTMQSIKSEENEPAPYKSLNGTYIPFGTYQMDFPWQTETITKHTFEIE